MNTETTTPRDDDALIGIILGSARQAAHCVEGRTLHEALGRPDTRRALQRHAQDMGSAALEVSEMMRNWATHVPWESIEALRGPGTATPEAEEATVSALWDFLHEQMPQVREVLEEMLQPAHLRRSIDPDEEYALDKNA